jgi:hypothetical protein
LRRALPATRNVAGLLWQSIESVSSSHAVFWIRRRALGCSHRPRLMRRFLRSRSWSAISVLGCGADSLAPVHRRRRMVRRAGHIAPLTLTQTPLVK